MKQIIEYLSTKVAKPSIIKATNDTIQKIVKDEIDRLGPEANLNHIDVSEVTNMYNLFSCDITDTFVHLTNELNPDISQWNVSNVIYMTAMFMWMKKFNCDISEWDVSNVRTMSHMFKGCRSFNQPIGNWNVSKVENMNSMFFKCDSFNQDLSKWKPNCHYFDWNIFKESPLEGKKEFLPKFKETKK
jgi:surface protein